MTRAPRGCSEDCDVRRRWSDRPLAFVARWSLASLVAPLLTQAVPGVEDDLRGFVDTVRGDDYRLLTLTLTAVFLAPVLETAIIAIAFRALARIGVRDSIAIVFVGTAFAAAHTASAFYALGVLPAGLVFAYVYRVRKRPPFDDGFWICATAHFVNNLAATASILIDAS